MIDSKAELKRQGLLSDAEANRIRVTAAPDSKRLNLEATVLKQNPMLIQKIIAERLSDKSQIMMVPIDGKNFFANDVFRLSLQPKFWECQHRPNRKFLGRYRRADSATGAGRCLAQKRAQALESRLRKTSPLCSWFFC